MVVDRSKVRWLERYQNCCDKVERLNNRIIGVQAIQYGDKVRGYNNKTINDYIMERDTLEVASWQIRDNIEDAVKNISDTYPRRILGYKYILGRSNEKIAKELNCSYNQVMRYHSKGIEQMRIDNLDLI